MFNQLLFSICISYCLAFVYKTNIQDSNFVNLSMGSCWDAATGVDLKSKIYAIINDKQVKLGDSDNKGIINLQIPTDSQFLIFESEGYGTVKKPVNFIGQFLGHSKFNMGIQMNLKGSTPIKKTGKEKYSRTQETMIFCVPDTHNKEIEYELYRAKERFFITNVSAVINGNISASYDGRIDHYLLVVKNKNGEILMEKDFVTKEGLNFIDLHVENQQRDIKAKVDEKMIFDSRILYFNQSSYDLQMSVKETLDSAAVYLSNHKKVNISVTGYSDNVGSKDLNVALSEFRAKAVAGYLRQKGVQPNQVIMQWKGPDSLAILKNTEESKIKSRRVVIQIIK